MTWISQLYTELYINMHFTPIIKLKMHHILSCCTGVKVPTIFW